MIKFLGHAGFMYETKNEMILMDPWMSKEGAFDSSWYQFPSNHKLGDEIRETISKTEKDVYIYISHEHKDHFDVPFLKTFITSKIVFSLQILIFFKFFFTKFETLFLQIKRYNLPFFEIISLQLTKGLFGRSLPLIFKSQLTFSPALLYK